MKRCKICQEKTNTLQLEKTYYYCPDCNYIFIDEREILKPKQEKNRYQQHNNSRENEGYVNMFNDFIDELIRPNLHKIDTALDFGCGPGPVLAELLAEEGVEVDIYDPFFYPAKFFNQKKYDLITATEVFEHLKEPLLEVQRLSRYLRDDGLLAIMTHFHPGPQDFADWWYHRDPTHVSFYNQDTMDVIAGKSSLKIISANGGKYCLCKKKS